MKRTIALWLAAALCATAIGGAALAEGQELPAVELELEEQALADTPALEEAELALDLDIEPLDIDDPQLPEAEDGLQNNDADGEAANKVVLKRFIRYEISGGAATVVSADKSITEANIPEKVNGYTVKHIAANAFLGCTKLWSLSVPDTVKDIGEHAFDSCVALVDVQLPSGLTQIGDYAFANCTKISHFELPDNLTVISEGLFENCQIMWKITLPAGLKTIGDNAFRRCLALREFTLPATLKTIGESAFELCEGMKRVTIPAGVSTIPTAAFKDCKSLSRLTFNSGLTSIGKAAFQNCESLPSLKLPATLDTVGPLAFAGCGMKTALTIPGNVSTLGYGAFYNCGDLKEVTLKSGVETIKAHCFAQCKKLEKVAIPASVNEMGYDAFTIGSASSINEEGDITLEAPLRQPKKLKIYGRPNTTASVYAADNGIPFVIQKIVATSVSIAEGSSATLYVGHTKQLTAVQTPSNAETTVKWTSSSSSVAVSKTGLLTPKRAGKAVITVRTENGKKARITVKVIDAKSVSITNGSSATMKVGQTLQLGATVNPVQVASKLTWSSSSKKIATVSKTGLVTALKKGTVTITVKTGNGKKAKIKIKVVG